VHGPSREQGRRKQAELSIQEGASRTPPSLPSFPPQTHLGAASNRVQLCPQHEQEGCGDGADARSLVAHAHRRRAHSSGQQLCHVQGNDGFRGCRHCRGQRKGTATGEALTSASYGRVQAKPQLPRLPSPAQPNLPTVASAACVAPPCTMAHARHAAPPSSCPSDTGNTLHAQPERHQHACLGTH
jgi:hypothetical protein